MDKQHWDISQNIFCARKKKSHRFATTWGWVNDNRIFILWRNTRLKPANKKETCDFSHLFLFLKAIHIRQSVAAHECAIRGWNYFYTHKYTAALFPTVKQTQVLPYVSSEDFPMEEGKLLFDWTWTIKYTNGPKTTFQLKLLSHLWDLYRLFTES